MSVVTKKNTKMIDLIKKLTPLRMGPNCDGLDQCVSIIKEELPFNVHEFEGGGEVNGWVVPMKWEADVALIKDREGKVIYDGNAHPLGVIGYSQAFTGKVKGEELKKHLFFPAAFDDALVYHCDLFYKVNRKEWGFSVTKNFYDSIDEKAEFDVELKTRFEKGTMKVANYILPGETDDTIVFNAHNCHAFCCNDDLAGVAVGIELMKRLAKQKKRRFTYRLIVAPEHFGTVFFIDKLSEKELFKLKWGVFLEMLGTEGPLALQRTFTGTSLFDRAFLSAFKNSSLKWRTEEFRKIVGNDETCWEAPGVEVPFASLSRFPYPEYHTSRDDISLIKEDKLEESVQAMLETLFIMENDSVMTRNFKGLVALSHPKYDLYQPYFDPSEPERRTIGDEALRWNYLMNCLPRYFDGQTRIIEIAERHEIPFKKVFDYVKKFEEKKLIQMSPAPAVDPEPRKLPPH